MRLRIKFILVITILVLFLVSAAFLTLGFVAVESYRYILGAEIESRSEIVQQEIDTEVNTAVRKFAGISGIVLAAAVGIGLATAVSFS
jgi:hypothetical protein